MSPDIQRTRTDSHRTTAYMTPYGRVPRRHFQDSTRAPPLKTLAQPKNERHRRKRTSFSTRILRISRDALCIKDFSVDRNGWMVPWKTGLRRKSRGSANCCDHQRDISFSDKHLPAGREYPTLCSLSFLNLKANSKTQFLRLSTCEGLYKNSESEKQSERWSRGGQWWKQGKWQCQLNFHQVAKFGTQHYQCRRP